MCEFCVSITSKTNSLWVNLIRSHNSTILFRSCYWKTRSRRWSASCTSLPPTPTSRPAVPPSLSRCSASCRTRCWSRHRQTVLVSTPTFACMCLPNTFVCVGLTSHYFEGISAALKNHYYNNSSEVQRSCCPKISRHL